MGLEVPQSQLGFHWATSGKKSVTWGLYCGTQFYLRLPLFTIPDPKPLTLRPRTPAFPYLDRGTCRVAGEGWHTVSCMRVGCVEAIADG